MHCRARSTWVAQLLLVCLPLASILAHPAASLVLNTLRPACFLMLPKSCQPAESTPAGLLISAVRELTLGLSDPCC